MAPEREHGIVSDGAADAPAAPGVAAEAWDSHANVLSNRGCMSPQRVGSHFTCMGFGGTGAGQGEDKRQHTSYVYLLK